MKQVFRRLANAGTPSREAASEAPKPAPVAPAAAGKEKLGRFRRLFRRLAGKNPTFKKLQAAKNLQKIAGKREVLRSLAEKHNISEDLLLGVVNRLLSVENRLSGQTSAQDIQAIRNEIASLRSQSRVESVGEIKDAIMSIEEKMSDLEKPDAETELKNKIADAEQEKKRVLEAKDATEKRYYKREIDEQTFKKMMQDYEQKNLDAEIKIKNFNDQLRNLKPAEKKPFEMRNIAKRYGEYRKQEERRLVAAQPAQQFQQAQFGMPQQIEMIREVLRQRETPGEARTELMKREFSQGVAIPNIEKPEEPEEEEVSYADVNLTYPLIPRNPRRGETVYAYANIRWDPSDNSLVYYLFEPKLTEEEKQILSKTKELLEEKLDIDLRKLKRPEAFSFLMRKTDEVFGLLNVAIPADRQNILKYYIRRDFIGLERIEPLMNDSQIEDISCDGFNIPIYIFHRNPKIGSIKTNVMFNAVDELDKFTIKLAQRCEKTVSVAEPLLSGGLADGSRVQATLGTDIARRGSNFTIRKFTEVPLTPIDLMNFGTINATALAYLWLAVEHGKSILIGGTTASGKTTLLNVLSLFIKPNKKIVSIEDTAELKLPHPHWVPEVARTAISQVEGRKIGEVDMFDLLKESLRQRPDYIIVGEVRGKEAYVLFQQMASGHAGLSTIHADSLPKLIDRLTTPPISLPASLMQNLDIVIFADITKFKKRVIRKTDVILEILGVENEKPVGNEVFRWNPMKNCLEIVGKSSVLKKIAYSSGLDEKSMQDEIANRIKVLQWMRDNNINDLDGVARIFSSYYHDPESVMGYVE
ncbi:MAG: ATPase, T2SS/T4P/T4SS family [Candidatus Aenigmatarchaeota archaeon]